MKISKLFHWLYAILMFLPILVFIPNAFYYGFNDTAVAQEKTEQVPVYYESNQPTTNNEIYPGRVYYWSDNYTSTLTTTGIFCHLTYNSLNQSLSYLLINANILYLTNYSVSTAINLKVTPMYFVIDTIDYSKLPSDFYEHVEETDYLLFKEYQDVTTNMSISDSMSYAWQSTWQNDLFSWSYVSFLTQPFLYITNLFNVPATNTLLYCLSYWLNISIIWLVFDVVMYVPLLVHRWLDKGIVE